MTLPLFDRFPGSAQAPRVELCSLPTPIDVVDGVLPSRVGFGLLLKRDDLTSSLYGGNKVRKLEFLLGEALHRGCKSVLTFGAYGSNHALATAVHARSLGLEPHVVLSPQEPGPFAAATLRAHAALGTVIHLVDGWDGRRAAVEAIREVAQRDGVEPLTIPMGGSDARGATGYVNAALEICDQLDAPADVVYLAGGTLGTALGLAAGFAAAGAPTRVETVRVTPAEVANHAYAQRLTCELIEFLREIDADFPAYTLDDLPFTLRDDWFEPGYGVVTPETTSAVELAASQGVKLETTYTGKAFAAMLADAHAGKLDGQRVLFLDTYNSAPMPAPGDVNDLPEVLQAYVARCDELFGGPQD